LAVEREGVAGKLRAALARGDRRERYPNPHALGEFVEAGPTGNQAARVLESRLNDIAVEQARALQAIRDAKNSGSDAA
jgi:hypothetical protein